MAELHNFLIRLASIEADMGLDKALSVKEHGHSRFLLPVLSLSVMVVWLITVSFGLLLIDVAQTFNIPVGTAGLLASVGSVSGIVAGLLLSMFSVRFNHKLLLLIGLTCTNLAAIGFYYAPTFELLLFADIGVGAGIATVTAMAYSLIGDFYPMHKRGRAIGCIVAASSLAFIIGGPVVGIIASVADWRAVMIWLVLPVSLAALILAFLAVPNKSHNTSLGQPEPFLAGCKQALRGKSTLASLSVTMFMLAEGSIGFYLISFFRSQFEISVDLGSIVVLVGHVVAAVGGVVAGLLVNRVGRKRLGTLTCLVASFLTLTFSLVPDFSVSWALSTLRYLVSGMALAAGGSLVIEQLPKFRSAMMSLNSVFMNLGMLLASLLSAAILNVYGYQAMAMVLGSLGILATVIWLLLVNEPCKETKIPSQE